MSELNERDWEILNAYHDGELPAAQSRVLEQRLYREPALAAALEDIRRVAAALQKMRPPPAPMPDAAPDMAPEMTPGMVAAPRGRGFPVMPLAFAASVALALVVAGGVFNSRLGEASTSKEWHSRFLNQVYSVAAPEDLRNTRIFGPEGVPDLSAANLTLVDWREGRNDALALHYAGRNGCRLTLTAGYGAGELVAGESDELSRAWVAGSVNFMVLATGMDRARFDAITTYMRQLTKQAAQPATVLAMRITTNRAKPCGK